MKATTTKHCSSPVTDFIKEKYMEALDNIIANIKANTVHSIETLITEEGKYQGMPKSIIPLKSDIQTAFEHVKNNLPSLSSNHTILVIPYGRPFIIGGTFSTKYFEKVLKPMQGRYFPGIVIALNPKHIKKLENVAHLGKNDLEKLWVKKDFGKKVEVQFMDIHDRISNVTPIIFSLWFAKQLASEYLKWCKEEEDLANEEVLSKCIAIAELISTKRPYSNCLTSATLLKSTDLADFSSSDSGTHKKQC